MSMLAEPRRKQRIINLRAKNNAWSNDANKFGQRMLEKMGWSSGKGLGAKENGIVEHVIARYKNDEKGLGYEDKNDQWTKHEDDFNALLANLSNDKNTSAEVLHSGVSLEKKSKKSKARIHYHKFTRGKDISRYSEKDLANIFGKKSFKNENVEETSSKDEVETTEQVFTEKGSMEDYFKTKMAALKSKNKITTAINEDSNENCDFAFKGFSFTHDDDNTNENRENNSFYNVKNQVTSLQETQSKDVPKKLKKKSKNKASFDNENNETDYVFQGFSCTETAGGEKSIETTNNSGIEEVQKELTEDPLEESVLPKKNKKKKKKTKDDEMNTEEKISDSNIDESIQIKKAKKKKNKDVNIEIDNTCLEEQNIDESGPPKKKKKRKNKDL